MKKINKIIFTGQMLRKEVKSSEWIYNLFAWSIKNLTGLDTYLTTISDAEWMNRDFHIPIDIGKIYNCFGKKYVYGCSRNKAYGEQWASIFYNTEYNKEFYDYVYSIFKDSLVISYELEDCMLAALDYFKIPYIEINLDPIRFLEDAMLCFRSSDKNVYKKILKYRIDEEFLYLSANYLSTVYKLAQKKHEDSKNVLFLGQTTCDKTIVDKEKNEMYSILNHKEEFLESIKGFDKVFYKRHPLVKDDEDVIDFIKSQSEIEIIEDNFYELLSRDDIKKVVSISSGTCSEAKYFGKETQCLLKEGVPRQIEDKIELDKYISVYQSFFSLNFWAEILSPLLKTRKLSKKHSIEGTRNKLRNSRKAYSIYYAYQDPEYLFSKEHSIKNLSEKIFKSFLAYEMEKEEYDI